MTRAMTKTGRTAVALLVASTLLLGACSSGAPSDSATGDGSRLGQKKDGKKASKKGAGKTYKKGKKGLRSGTSGRRGPGSGGGRAGSASSPPPAAGGAAAPSGGGFASDGPPSPVDPSLARRSSFYDDPKDDAKKDGALVPGYAEVVRCGIQGVGENFEMHFQFNGTVPQEMPDKNTIMVIGFGISAGGNDTYGFTAQGNQEGWKAYAGAKDGAEKFPGRFLIQGDTVVMRVPWSFINGPRRFRWQLNATWFRSLANTTHYSFDQCPNDTAGEFPR